MSITWADVSEFQQSIDWPVYGATCTISCSRVHNGYRPDNYLTANLNGSRAHVSHPGWYHYLVKGRDPIDQARDFLATIVTVRPGEWVMLDAESADLRFDGTDVARAEAWLQFVAEHLPGIPCTIYSEGSSFMGPLAGINPRWPKVVASILNATSPSAPDWLRPSMGEIGWQFSWAHQFPGIASPCDADSFDGSLAQWVAAIGMSTPKPHVIRPSHVPMPPKGHPAYKFGDGGNNLIGIGVAATQNGLRFVTGAPLWPSSPPALGHLTEKAIHDFQVVEKLIPANTPVHGCAAGSKTIARLNQMIDQKKV